MAKVPPITLKGRPVPVERFAGFAPDGSRTDTPATLALLVLALLT